MNGLELVAEVQKIVDAGASSFSDEQVLSYINRGMTAVANILYLPWLGNGQDIVITDTTVQVDLPDDYHKNLFMATTEEEGQVAVMSSIKSIADDIGPISADENNNVKVVSAIAGKLLYQSVPSDPTEITLFYYRKHATITADADSVPEWDNDDLDNTLINYAAWQMFALLEQGIEGQKISTMYHKNEYKEYLESVKDICIVEGRSFVAPKTNKVW